MIFFSVAVVALDWVVVARDWIVDAHVSCVCCERGERRRVTNVLE